MERFRYGLYEILSVLAGLAVCALLVHYFVVGSRTEAAPFVIIDLNVSPYVDVVIAFISYVFSKTSSIYAAHEAKSLGAVEYERLNNSVHKWVVLGTSAAMFTTMLVIALLMKDWLLVSHLGGAAFLYLVFSVIVKVKPHSFGARVRSVVLIQLAIATGILMLLPSTLFLYIMIVGCCLVAGGAIGNLWKEQKKYNWPTR